LELTFAPPGNGLSGGIVYRHGNSAVSIVGFRSAGHTTPADKAVARQAGRHIIWGTAELSRIVP